MNRMEGLAGRGWLALLALLAGGARADRCYLCSNMDVAEVVDRIQDTRWRTWLQAAATDPKVDECGDRFAPEVALRSGVKSQECEQGTCLKMVIREKTGGSFYWRSCLANSASQVRADCTKVTTGSGEMEICTCFGNLCNHSLRFTTSFALIACCVTTILSLNLIYYY